MTKIYKVVRDRWGTCNLFLWNHVDTLFFIPLIQGDFSVDLFLFWVDTWLWSLIFWVVFLVTMNYCAVFLVFYDHSVFCSCICNTYFDKFDITIVPYRTFLHLFWGHLQMIFYTKGWTNALSICNGISFLIFYSMSPFRCVNLTFIQ